MTTPAPTILNFKPLEKNTLRGFFDLSLPSGMVLCGCALHEKGDDNDKARETGDSDGRPTIQLSHDLHADLCACERELISSNLAEVYQRAGYIVRRGTGKGKTHKGETVVFDRIVQHNANSLRTILSKTINFEAWNAKTKKLVPRHPPKDYAGLLLDHPDKNYPILHGLISAPTLRADGSVLDVPGYDERSGLYFDPKGVDFGTIPQNPTREDALAALAELNKPIAKFPFIDEASKSVQLARMLTGVVRTALMTSPMFGYTAPQPRTGKSLLVDIACTLSHGHVAPVIIASSTFEELDKQLQASLAGGDTIVTLDNQNSDEVLTSEALSQMLTQPIVKIRPFGQNKEMPEYPSMSVISATGNNLAVAKDLTERTLLCQLDAKMEVPGARKFAFNPIVMARETGRGSCARASLSCGLMWLWGSRRRISRRWAALRTGASGFARRSSGWGWPTPALQ